MKKLFGIIVLFALSLMGSSAPKGVLEAQICVYGGTSAGVVAAVAAAREGKIVLLIEPTQHVGGMSASGLGNTDRGDTKSIGGLAREFYKRVGSYYGESETWKFEPRVAEAVFNDMLQQARVRVVLGSRIISAEKSGTEIDNITIEGPGGTSKVYADEFIDAGYEGDLLARAGVSYVVGRESRQQYDEPLAGVRGFTPYHQFQIAIDPYKRKGDPSSGLLPLINEDEREFPGSGDEKLPAYCYRLCLTRMPLNRVAIDEPYGYDESRYELLARYVESLTASGKKVMPQDLLDFVKLPNGKTDVNNKGPISADYIGENYRYPEAGYAERARIEREHEQYLRGLIFFLARSPRMPLSLRKEMKAWGLAKDEFSDNGNWPYRLYVREARRMVGRYVITQSDCDHVYKADDSIGFGSYNIDSHNVQRYASSNRIYNEGDVQVKTRIRYPISYSALTPKEQECTNLLVPVCVSASHIAYSSLRMEPTFMVMAHAAGIAASEALDYNRSVQRINVSTVRYKLRAARQIID